MSVHAKEGVNCLDCHQSAPGQKKGYHHGFVISDHLTAGNCLSCHESEYEEPLRSRHAALSWAGVYGEKGLSSQEVAFSEQLQPGGDLGSEPPIFEPIPQQALVTRARRAESFASTLDR